MQGLIAAIIWFILLIIFSIIFGEIRFRIYLKRSDIKSKKQNKEKNEIEIQNDEKHDNGFHKSDIKPLKNCCNPASYGMICVRCGRCGRILE